MLRLGSLTANSVMAVTRWIVIERHGSHILRKIYRQPLQHHALPRNFRRHPVSSSPTSVLRLVSKAVATRVATSGDGLSTSPAQLVV